MGGTSGKEAGAGGTSGDRVGKALLDQDLGTQAKWPSLGREPGTRVE